MAGKEMKPAENAREVTDEYRNALFREWMWIRTAPDPLPERKRPRMSQEAFIAWRKAEAEAARARESSQAMTERVAAEVAAERDYIEWHIEEVSRLRDDLEKWKAYARRLKDKLAARDEAVALERARLRDESEAEA